MLIDDTLCSPIRIPERICINQLDERCQGPSLPIRQSETIALQCTSVIIVWMKMKHNFDRQTQTALDQVFWWEITTHARFGRVLNLLNLTFGEGQKFCCVERLWLAQGHIFLLKRDCSASSHLSSHLFLFSSSKRKTFFRKLDFGMGNDHFALLLINVDPLFSKNQDFTAQQNCLWSAPDSQFSVVLLFHFIFGFQALGFYPFLCWSKIWFLSGPQQILTVWISPDLRCASLSHHVPF